MRSHVSARCYLGAALLAVIALAGACNAPAAMRTPAAAPTDAPRPTRAPETAVPFTPRPTETPEPTATPTDTPPPPTDTPRPWPTPQVPHPDSPVDRSVLAPADLALHNGDFVTAAQLYAAARDADGTPDEIRAAAWLGLGTAYLRDGLFLEAAQALSGYFNTYPDDAGAADGTFLYAEALRSSEDYAGALAAYERYLTMPITDTLGATPGILAPYVYDRMGDSYLDLGDYAGAIATYTLGLDTAPFDLNLSMREKIAQAYLSLGDTAGAVAMYDELTAIVAQPGLAATYSYYDRSRYIYLAGAALLAAGDYEGAYARFEELVANYPRTYDSYSALIVLLDAGVPVDDFLRGRVDYYAGAYDPALRALYNYITDNNPHGGDAHYFAGLSYLGLGNYQAAATEFQTLIEDHPDASTWSDAWLERAEALALDGDIEGAIAAYTALSEQYPGNGNAAEGLWQALRLAERYQDYPAAERAGAALANYPAYANAPAGLLHAGLAAYRLGDLAGAQAYWQQLAGGYANSPAAAAAYLWLGKTAGDPAAASQLFARAASLNPAGYYGLRAADLAAGRAPLAADASPDLAFDETAERRAAEAWLARYLGIADDGTLGQLQPALSGDLRIRRGAALWRLGLYAEAKTQLDAARAEYAADPLASYQFALFFRDLGAYRSSILAARSVIATAGLAASTSSSDYVLQEPLYFARLAYPTYYSDLVLTESDKWGMDPLLVFSVISQESVFEGFARSYAAAQGLMQIIPSTGIGIANALDWPDYRNELLYRPYVNVPFGVYYLAAQRDRFNGDLQAALAAYNAGPGNSARWVEFSSGDPDLYYESITMQEPRLYIQKVYERWVVYKALYGQ